MYYKQLYAVLLAVSFRFCGCKNWYTCKYTCKPVSQKDTEHTWQLLIFDLIVYTTV